jgi:two-component system sensor histidine kinase/response regulator
MNANRKKLPLSWTLTGVFLIVSAIVIFLGIKFIRNQKENLIDDKKDELKTITDLKAGQIAQWRHERMGDAIIIQDNLSLIDQVSDFLKKTDNTGEKIALLRWMNSIVRNYDYFSVAITDIRGKVRLSCPAGDSTIGPFLRPLIQKALKDKKIILTDLHSVAPDYFVHIDLVVPVVKKESSDSVSAGLIILRIDPRIILYPLVRSWPTQSKTSETLLLRLDGDSIIYLNELRHLPYPALSVKRSVYENNFIGAMAVKGFEGLAEGTDYRNVPVLAAVKKVPESSWYMVSKVDLEEINSLFADQRNLARLLIIFFVSAFGAILGWTIWHQRMRFYRNKYEAELEKLALKKHFDFILKYANDIVLLIDSDLQIIEANDRAREVYQYTREELIGMNIVMLRLPRLASQLDYQLKILKDVGSTTYETVHRRKDGTTFPIEISARQFEIEGVRYYQSIGRDITERKRIEENLKELLNRYNLATQTARLAVWEWDITNDKLIWDDRVFELYGVNREDLLPVYDSWLKILHPDDIEKTNLTIEKAISDGTEYSTEFRVIHPDGSVKYIKAFGQVIKGENGKSGRLIGINYDISPQKKSEIELEKSLSLLKATIESTADGLLVVDTKGKIVQYNRKFAEMWKIPQEILDKQDDNLAISFVRDQLTDPGTFVSNVQHLYSSPEMITYDILEFKDGRVFERYSQPQKINNLTVGRVWSFRDVTQKKLAESQLVSAKEKAEESDRLKTAFLHNISHEIRTPMNAIVGFTALLDEPDLEPESRTQFINIIYQSTNQLLSIISDIVDISNIETNQVKLTLSEVKVNQVIRSLYSQFKLTADKEKILFRYITKLPDEQAVITTDKTKFVQILSNLLNNAFKFTRQGTVQFGYGIAGENLEFFVKDTGIGVSEGEQSRIFDRFYQVENKSSRQYAGAGLGLSICKAYVELLGGRIWLNSKPDKGSEFCFTLPFAV